MSRERSPRTGIAALLAVSTAFAGIVLVGGSQAARGGERNAAVVTSVDLPPKSVLLANLTIRSATSVAPPAPSLLVRVLSSMPITSRPGGGTVIGILPAASKYYHVPIVAWVLRTSADGRYGEVTVPYSGTGAVGWIPLRALKRERTAITVRAYLSRHLIAVERAGEVIMRFPVATGAASSPTPPGRYFVTDRVPFPSGGYLGTFAFGLSGIQTHLPAGWSGGNQLAIHGTNDPSSIGTSVSAGCLRVSEQALARLEPLLRLGTPVIITR